MNDIVKQSPPESHARPGHETTDVSLFSISLFASGLALMIAVVLLLLAWAFWRLELAAQRADVPQSPFSDPPTFREPKLQAQPTADLAHFRRDEDERLSSYGWIDQPQGVARVPIELAIKILTERGIPEPRGAVEPAEKQDLKP